VKNWEDAGRRYWNFEMRISGLIKIPLSLVWAYLKDTLTIAHLLLKINNIEPRVRKLTAADVFDKTQKNTEIDLIPCFRRTQNHVFLCPACL